MGMIYRRRLFAGICSIILASLLASCVTTSERAKRDYGLLESAVTFSSDKVYGEYAENIPDDFDGAKFISFVKGRIPEDYYDALISHEIAVVPMKSYYLLKVFDKGVIILFDYSCTPGVDGPVLTNPGKYDLSHIEKYDSCSGKSN